MNLLMLYHAGALRNAVEIYSSIAKHPGIEVTAVVPERIAVDRIYDPSGLLCVEKPDESYGYRMVPLPLVDPKRYFLGFENGPLKRFLKNNRAAIIHVWDEPVSYCLYHVAGLRWLFARGSQVLFYGFQNIPFKGGVLGRVISRSAWTQVAGGATANSEAMSNLRRWGFPKSRPVERIFWGIPTDLFRPMAKFALRENLKLDCEYVVGYVGRLVPEKGLAWLLAAVQRLPAHVHCLIIGSGPMRGEIELWSDLPRLAGRVHILEPKRSEEMPNYLNCMDVLAVPSLTTMDWKEQYGRVVAEAMACGVPVVGSDSGAIPEVVDSAGWIVPEGDVAALAEALHDAIFGEKRQSLIQQGLQRAEEELSVRAMSRQLIPFYDRVL